MPLFNSQNKLSENMPGTTQEVLEALRQKIYADLSLQARLFGLVDAGEFCLAVQETALEMGLELGEEAVWAALHQGGVGWHGRLLQ